MRISDWSSDVCSSDLRFLRRLMLRLQIVETIEVCRENLMLGFAGLQDLRSSPGDLQRLNKTGALFLLGLVRQLPLDNFQSAARGLQLAEARFERIEPRSEEHTSELQSLMRLSYAVFCLTNKIHLLLPH